MANQLLRSTYKLLLTITLFEVKTRYRHSDLGLAFFEHHEANFADII